MTDGPDAWIVGGAVRERLRGQPITDVDVAIAGDDAAGPVARALARRAGGHPFRLSDAFGAWRVSAAADADPAWQVDLTPLQGPDLAADVARRDLTVNALAVPVAGGPLVDLVGGEEDLRAGRLRAVGTDAFAADPVRVVRLARFAAELAADPEAETLARARAAAPALADVPGERVLPELLRALTGPGRRRGVRVAAAAGALHVLLPAATDPEGVVLPAVDAALEALLGAPAGVPEAAEGDRAWLAARAAEPSRRETLALAALVHGAPDPAAALAPLRPSRARRTAVARAVAAVPRVAALPPAADAVALYAALRPAGTDAPEALLLARALLGPADVPWAPLAARAVRWAAGPPAAPVTGDELVTALGVPRGPALGALLTRLAIAHDAGELGGRDDALALARRLHATDRAATDGG
nr:hypothetical protein [Patulibacter sp. SYSU D01012]